MRKIPLSCQAPTVARSGLPGLRLKLPTITRHRKAERKIDQADEDVDLDAEGLPGGVDDRSLGGGQEVEDADDQHQAGILEEGDKSVHQWRDHMPDRLRQDDERVFL